MHDGQIKALMKFFGFRNFFSLFWKDFVFSKFLCCLCRSHEIFVYNNIELIIYVRISRGNTKIISQKSH